MSDSGLLAGRGTPGPAPRSCSPPLPADGIDIIDAWRGAGWEYCEDGGML